MASRHTRFDAVHQGCSTDMVFVSTPVRLRMLATKSGTKGKQNPDASPSGLVEPEIGDNELTAAAKSIKHQYDDYDFRFLIHPIGPMTRFPFC